MPCPTGQIEKFFPPMTSPMCMPETQAKAIDEANKKAKNGSTTPTTTTNTGLPQWAKDLLGASEQIGKGVGAATGKGAPVVIAPPTPEPTTMPQWVWFVGAGMVVLVVFTLIRRK